MRKIGGLVMLTTFVNVKQELFTFNKELLKAAQELLILEEAVLVSNDSEKYEYFTETYQNFNSLIQELIGFEVNNLMVWRIKGKALQICIMDYLNDGNIYQVLHYPKDEELKQNGKEALVNEPLELTTFDEFAEEATDEEKRNILPVFPKVTIKTNDEMGVTD